MNAATIEPYLRVDSFSHTEPVAIHAYTTRWQGALRSGSDAITHNWFESGACYAAFCAGWVERLDYEIKANRDTAEFYYLTRNRLDLTPGRAYVLRARVFEQRSRGPRLAYRAEPLGGFSLELGLSLLDAMRMTNGEITGSALVNGPKDYNYNAQVAYFYSRDHLFERQTPAPAGNGLSLDVSAAWRINEDFYVHAQVRDAYGYLKWERAPFTTATVDSSNKQFGPDGYVTYNPTLHGFEGNSDYRQRLHPRALLSPKRAGKC